MKFLDKVKNMFTEVVEEDEKKDEVKIEKIEPEKKEIKALEEFNKIKPTEIKEERKPVFFTDDDFNDLDSYFVQDNVSKKEEPKEISRVAEKVEKKDKKNYDPLASANEYLEKYNEENGHDNEPYQGNTKIETKTSKFKPTPIISPVYGILDKNYHKEDIVSKNDPEYKSVDGLSVDSIRDKAYGTLEDELENTLFGSNSFLFKESKDEEDKNDNTEFFDEVKEEAEILPDESIKGDDDSDEELRDLENITMDIGKELDTLLSKDKETKEDEVKEEDSDDDLFNLIDTMYDGDDK